MYRMCHLKEVLQQYDSLLDVCRITRPHQAPGVLELGARAHLGRGGEEDEEEERMEGGGGWGGGRRGWRERHQAYSN